MPQIQEMARMTAAQRLELLKEVGGSTVYEERRNESQKVLEDTQRRRIKVGGGTGLPWRAHMPRWSLWCWQNPQLVRGAMQWYPHHAVL